MFRRINLKRMTVSAFVILCTIFFNAICCFASEPPKENTGSHEESPFLGFVMVDPETGNCYEDVKIGDYIDAWFASHLYDDNI